MFKNSWRVWKVASYAEMNRLNKMALQLRKVLCLPFVSLIFVSACVSGEQQCRSFVAPSVVFADGILKLPSHYGRYARPSNPVGVTEFYGPSDEYISTCRTFPRTAGRLLIGPIPDVVHASVDTGRIVSTTNVNGIKIQKLQFSTDNVFKIRGVRMERNGSAVMIIAEHASEIAEELASSFVISERK